MASWEKNTPTSGVGEKAKTQISNYVLTFVAAILVISPVYINLLLVERLRIQRPISATLGFCALILGLAILYLVLKKTKEKLK